MKAGSDTLLYIIISVVLLVISSLNKNKKKKAISSEESEKDQPGMPTHGNPWEKELEDIFGKVLGQEPEVVQKSEPKLQPVIQSAETKNEPIQSKQPQNQFQKVALSPEVSHPSPSFVYHEEEPEERHIELNGPDLEKAVIYAEILNRKYF